MKYKPALVALLILISFNNFTIFSQPPLHFTIAGWVYFEGDGVVANASVMVKNLRTGEINNATTNSEGMYVVYISDWQYGDELFIEAFYENWYGNESYIIESGYTAVVNITLYRTVTPPTISFSPSFSSWTNGDIIVNITITDDEEINITRYAWSNSQEKPSTWSNWHTVLNDTYSFQVEQENEGIWYLHVEAYDNEGNYEWNYSGEYKIDKSPPLSHVIKFSSYFQAIPFIVKVKASDALSGVNYVKLFYRYSPDNFSWSPWLLYGLADETYQWNFNAPNGSGYYQFYSIACDNVGNEESKSQEDAICFANYPPDKPYSPYPENGSINTPLNVTLSWQCDDIDGNALTYDVYFGDKFPLQKIAENITANNYSIESLKHETIYYWYVVAWDEYGAKNTSQIWHFTTLPNNPPTCSIEANPSVGKPPLNVTFFINASDIDGSIALWQLDIDGDDSAEYEGPNDPPVKLTHTYNEIGLYVVNLTVIDDDGAKAFDTANVIVSNAPSKPILNGPTYGYTNVTYSFEASAYDIDGDRIRYGFDWNNDSIVDEWTTWYNSNESAICNHSWEKKGVYAIKIIAEDENGVKSEWSNILLINITILSINHPPYKPTNPTPPDNATNISINPTLKVYVFDPDGDTLNVSFYDVYDNLIGIDENVNSGSYASIKWNNLNYNTTYKWYAVVNDGKETNISQIWQFTTKINYPPFIISINPENGSTVNTSINLSFTIVDKEGDSFNFILKTNFGINGTRYNLTNNTFSYQINLQYNRTYYWNISVWDAQGMKNYSFYFFTRGEIYSYEIIGSPRYNQWISLYTPIKFVSNAEKIYYRIWHDGQWHPAPGTGKGKDNNFWVFNGSFRLNEFDWARNGLYYFEFYGAMEGNLHNLSLYVDCIIPSANLTASCELTNEKNITLFISSNDNVGIKEVKIYYSYSKNKSWNSWLLINEYNASKFNITFNFSLPGFYVFLAIAEDLLNNTESFPATPDCIVRYYTTDLNDDGKTNVLDLVKLIKYWEAENADYDLNGDGIVNVKDLLLLLLNWTG